MRLNKELIDEDAKYLKEDPLEPYDACQELEDMLLFKTDFSDYYFFMTGDDDDDTDLSDYSFFRTGDNTNSLDEKRKANKAIRNREKRELRFGPPLIQRDDGCLREIKRYDPAFHQVCVDAFDLWHGKLYKKLLAELNKPWDVENTILIRNIENRIEKLVKSEWEYRQSGQWEYRRSEQMKGENMNSALKNAILRSGFRQYEIAKRSKIENSRFSKIVMGHIKPNLVEMKRISDVIGVATNELFDNPGGIVNVELKMKGDPMVATKKETNPITPFIDPFSSSSTMNSTEGREHISKNAAIQKSVEILENAIVLLENSIIEIKEGGVLGKTQPGQIPARPLAPIAALWETMPITLGQFADRIQKMKDNLMEIFF